MAKNLAQQIIEAAWRLPRKVYLPNPDANKLPEDPFPVLQTWLTEIEYAILEIPKYWIVDPIQEIVTVCTLIEGFYDAVAFQRLERIISSTFPQLDLSTKQVLAGRK